MTDLILYPFSGNAREAVAVIDAINQSTPWTAPWNLLGFVDDNPELTGKEFHGFPVLGTREKLHQHRHAKVLACPGRPETFRERDSVIDALDIPPERFATLIHPSAEIGLGCTVGYNTLLMAGVVLTLDARAGNHCVVLPNTVISHESTIGDYTLVGSNVSVSGGVRIGPKCYIGTGARIIQEIEIASGTLVAMGSVVIRPTEADTTVAGNPARPIRTRTGR